MIRRLYPAMGDGAAVRQRELDALRAVFGSRTETALELWHSGSLADLQVLNDMLAECGMDPIQRHGLERSLIAVAGGARNVESR